MVFLGRSHLRFFPFSCPIILAGYCALFDYLFACVIVVVLLLLEDEVVAVGMVETGEVEVMGIELLTTKVVVMVGAEVVMMKVEAEVVEVVPVEVTKAKMMVDMVRFLHL